MQVGGKFYLAGGGTAHQKYDPQTNAWSNVKPLPAALDHIQGVALGGKIYYVGGLQNWPSPHVSTVYIYDPQTDSFSTGASMGTRGRGAGGVAAYDGKIYYAGGLSNGQAVNWLDVYDPQSNQWSALPNMPTARDHFHAVALNGKLWAIGGRTRDIGATVTANEAFDFSSKTWSVGHKPLPTPRGGFAAAASGDEVLIIGGEDASKAHGTVEAYNVKTDSWRALESMPTPRHGIQAASCNGGLYIAAGGTAPGHNPSQAHEAYFPGGVKTSCGAQVSFAKKGVSGVSSSSPTSLQFGPDGRLYVSQQDGDDQGVHGDATSAGRLRGDGDRDDHRDPVDAEPQRRRAARPGRHRATRHRHRWSPGTAATPVIYVGSSDPRIGAGAGGRRPQPRHELRHALPAHLERVELGQARSRPRACRARRRTTPPTAWRSSPDGNTLYVAQGGNTNKGGAVEQLRAAARVRAVGRDPRRSTSTRSATRPTTCRRSTTTTGRGPPTPTTRSAATTARTRRSSSPAGRCRCTRPASATPTTSSSPRPGKMYTIDNGGNAGWGGVPIGEGPGGTCTNARSRAGQRPTATRCTWSAAPATTAGTPTRPAPTRRTRSTPPDAAVAGVGRNPVECDFRSPGTRPVGKRRRCAGDVRGLDQRPDGVHRLQLRRRDDGRPVGREPRQHDQADHPGQLDEGRCDEPGHQRRRRRWAARHHRPAATADRSRAPSGTGTSTTARSTFSSPRTTAADPLRPATSR